MRVPVNPCAAVTQGNRTHAAATNGSKHRRIRIEDSRCALLSTSHPRCPIEVKYVSLADAHEANPRGTFHAELRPPAAWMGPHNPKSGNEERKGAHRSKGAHELASAPRTVVAMVTRP